MSGKLIGYSRVSSTDQSLDIQIKQLTEAGCEKIFSEQRSGTDGSKRPEMDACLAYLRDGDTLIITRMDRIARSIVDFFKIMDVLKTKGVEFKVLLQPEIDTTTPNGRLITTIFAAIAEFETEVRKERQREGIAAAKARGVYDSTTGKRFQKGNTAWMKSPAIKRRSPPNPSTPSAPAGVTAVSTPESPPVTAPVRRGFFGRPVRA